jgi:hypothetical protein
VIFSVRNIGTPIVMIVAMITKLLEEKRLRRRILLSEPRKSLRSEIKEDEDEEETENLKTKMDLFDPDIVDRVRVTRVFFYFIFINFSRFYLYK